MLSQVSSKVWKDFRALAKSPTFKEGDGLLFFPKVVAERYL
jgi:hypothetical protein